MALSNKVSSDILVTTFFTASLKVRGLLFIPLFTIGLSVGDYGAFVQAFGIATIAANVVVLGFDTGLVQLSSHSEEVATLFSTMTTIATGMALLGAGVIALLAPLLSTYTLSSSAYGMVFVMAALYLPFEALFRMSRGYYHSVRRVKLHSAIEAVDVWLMVGSVALVILAFDGTLVAAFGAIVVAKAILTTAITLPIIATIGVARPSIKTAREALSFSLPTMGGDLAKHALDKADRILIGFFIGAGAVGVYSVAYSVSYLILLFVTPVNNSFYTEFSKLWQEGDTATIQQYTATGIRYFSTLAIPAIVGLWHVGEDVVNLLSTPDVADSALIPLVLIAGAMFLRGIAEVYQRLFYATGDSTTPLKAQLGMVGLNVVLNVLLIPIIGVIGAALTTVVSFALGALALGGLFQRELPTAPEWATLGRITLAALVMSGVVAPLSLPWAGAVALGAFVYFAALLALGGLTKSEIDHLRTMVMNT